DAPNITRQPADVTVSEGHAASFSVSVTGASLTYRWQKFDGSAWQDLTDGGDVSGATTANLSIANAAADDAGQYRVVVSNSLGSPAVRPFVPEFSGQAGGSFTPATTGPYTKADVAYRITLTVTDSGGLTRTVTRDVAPNVATLTVQTKPAGLVVTIDDQPFM